MPPLAVRFGLAPSFLFATGVCATAWLCNLGGAAMGRSRAEALRSAPGAPAAQRGRCPCGGNAEPSQPWLSALPPPFWVLLLMLSTGSIVSSSMDALYTDTLVEW